MLAAAFRQTPRLALDANGRYDRTDEAGELNFETGVLLPRTRAARWELGPSFTYKATPVVTIHGQYNWVQESLESGIATDEHVGRFVVSRQLSGRASIDAGYVGRRFINGDNAETSQAALAGATYGLGPFTTLTVQGGPRYSSARRMEPEIVASLGTPCAEHHPIRHRLLARRIDRPRRAGPGRSDERDRTSLRAAQTERGDRHGGRRLQQRESRPGPGARVPRGRGRLVAPQGPLRGRRVVRRGFSARRYQDQPAERSRHRPPCVSGGADGRTSFESNDPADRTWSEPRPADPRESR